MINCGLEKWEVELRNAGRVLGTMTPHESARREVSRHDQHLRTFYVFFEQCRHDQLFMTPPPVVGDEVYCRACRDYRLVSYVKTIRASG